MANLDFNDLIPTQKKPDNLASQPSFDDLVPKTPPAQTNQFISAITDIPHEVYEAGKSAVTTIGENLNPFSESRRSAIAKASKSPSFLGTVGDVIGQTADTGKGLLAIPELIASPITGTARSAIGHPFSAVTGIPYDEAKGNVDTAMMGLAPSRGGLSTLRGPAVPPPPPGGPLGVTLSEGQITQELPAIRREQAAVRGQLGPQAETRAKEFFEQQKGEVATAQENVAKKLDPFGQVIAESPQEAGSIASQAVQDAAAARKAGVKQSYVTAQSFPGEIHAGAFEGIGPKIKSDLSLGSSPVIIDDKLTPFASRAIQDIEDRVSKLKIQNRADPYGQPSQENISGVTLKGVDQMRKRLSAFRKDAFSSGNAADGRAAAAVLDSFDTQINNAVNGGLFNGDKRAIQAWNDARAAYSDYRKTFTAGKNDPVGRVVEKITGKGNNPAAIPNDVADFIYGSSGVNPNSLNVGVARRIKKIMGETSPEWSGVKQGLFSRIIEPPPGVTDFGPGRMAQRINKFLNGDGKEMSQVIFSPSERSLIQQYGNLQRSLEVPPTGANRSETSTFMASMLRKIGGKLGMVVGAAVGHVMLPGMPWGVSEAIGAGTSKLAGMAGDRLQAKAIAKQMPIVADATRKWQAAVNKANKANSPQSNAAVAFAATNLARSLKPVGIDFGSLMRSQGTVPAGAEENQ